jgi:tetratricopeptide (TPR) repeat protein
LAGEADRIEALTLDRLLGVLPDTPELGPLRESLLAASLPDPSLSWTTTQRYATFDRRVMEPAAIDGAVTQARAAALARIDRLYTGIHDVLHAAAAGNPAVVAARLLALGEDAEAAGEIQHATACYALAASVGAPLTDRAAMAFALRRLARARLTGGELEEARRLYRASLQQATSADDRIGRIVALTGLGNVFSLCSQWAAAVNHYSVALGLCTPEDRLLQAQLHANLAMVAREEGRPADAVQWLETARSAWSEMSEADRANWNNLAGLVALSREDYDVAEAAFAAAARLATDDFTRAMIFDNVAELALRRHQYPEAEASARQAEQYALRAGSPRALTEIYTRLGRIFSAQQDANGVTFFEKALELAMRHGYSALEADVCDAYAEFRAALGDSEEAAAYETRARELRSSLPAT